MQVLGNRILVKKLPAVEKIAGQFETVQAGDDFTYKGLVVESNLLNVPINSVVAFSAYSPDIQQIEYQGEIMKIITEQDVLAIL